MKENGEGKELLIVIDFAISEGQEASGDREVYVSRTECDISGIEEDCAE
jgi:hypothetical protein